MKYTKALLIVLLSIVVLECISSFATAIVARHLIAASDEQSWIMNLRLLSISAPMIMGAILTQFAIQPRQTQPKLYAYFVLLLLFSFLAGYSGFCLGNLTFAMFNNTGFPLLQYSLSGPPKGTVLVGFKWSIAAVASSAVFVVTSVAKVIVDLAQSNKTSN